MLGRRLALLVRGKVEVGNHELTIEIQDNNGKTKQRHLRKVSAETERDLYIPFSPMGRQIATSLRIYDSQLVLGVQSSASRLHVG